MSSRGFRVEATRTVGSCEKIRRCDSADADRIRADNSSLHTEIRPERREVEPISFFLGPRSDREADRRRLISIDLTLIDYYHNGTVVARSNFSLCNCASAHEAYVLLGSL